MNFLAAMLLLVLEKEEEDAFWVLMALLDDGAGLPALCDGKQAKCLLNGKTRKVRAPGSPSTRRRSVLRKRGSCRHSLSRVLLAKLAGMSCGDASS